MQCLQQSRVPVALRLARVEIDLHGADSRRGSGVENLAGDCGRIGSRPGMRFEANDGDDRRARGQIDWLVARMRGDESIAPGNSAREDGDAGFAGIDVGQMFRPFPGPEHNGREAR